MGHDRMNNRLQLSVKRALDVVVSALGLFTLAPVSVGIGVAICLDSEGPPLFNATRVGLAGRPFTMYKFRTMTVDAEARLADLQQWNRGGAMLIRIPNDPRTTRVGRLLRRTSLDEVPQLLNVLKGEMSLVGPRPQYPREVARYTAEQRRRLDVAPGITGLWQVSARESADFRVWVKYDLEYIEDWSIRRDLSILWRTTTQVFNGFRRTPEQHTVQDRGTTPTAVVPTAAAG